MRMFSPFQIPAAAPQNHLSVTSATEKLLSDWSVTVITEVIE